MIKIEPSKRSGSLTFYDPEDFVTGGRIKIYLQYINRKYKQVKVGIVLDPKSLKNSNRRKVPSLKLLVESRGKVAEGPYGSKKDDMEDLAKPYIKSYCLDKIVDVYIV